MTRKFSRAGEQDAYSLGLVDAFVGHVSLPSSASWHEARAYKVAWSDYARRKAMKQKMEDVA